MEAKQILAAKKINDREQYKRVCSILSGMGNDLEAADLWKRLQELSKRT
jgi:hypothetical protein